MSIDSRLQELGDRLERSVAADLRAAQRSATTSRVRRRPVMIGIAATGLAAVGVATVLVVSSGSGSTPANGPSTGGPALPAATGHAGVQDTAYIVKRVSAKIAADAGHANTVQQRHLYAIGDVGSDGSLVNLGSEWEELDTYTAPDGTRYLHGIEYAPNRAEDNTDRTPILIFASVIGPVLDGRESFSGTSVDPADHTYSQHGQAEYSIHGPDAAAPPTPNLSSSPSQVQQALQGGQVTRIGTPTFNGTAAIALSIKRPGAENNGGQDTLYVDPKTYQPLGQAFSGRGGVDVSYWMPATPANIAQVKEAPSIPAGYAKVAWGG